MTSSEQIRIRAKEAEPLLEASLKSEIGTNHIDTSLQLRHSQCGLASTALQTYLYDQYQIETQRVIVEARNAPKNMEFQPIRHVALRTEDDMIDPTYGQFMNLIGLTTKVAQHHNLHNLYPEKKIMVYSLVRAVSFANAFASHVHIKDTLGVVPPVIAELQPDGALRGASLERMQESYQSIWSPDDYSPYHLDDPVKEEGMQEAAARISARMQYLRNK